MNIVLKHDVVLNNDLRIGDIVEADFAGTGSLGPKKRIGKIDSPIQTAFDGEKYCIVWFGTPLTGYSVQMALSRLKKYENVS